MMNEHPGWAYGALKRMGVRPGDCENNGVFNILSNQNEMSYIANISQQFEPLNLD